MPEKKTKADKRYRIDGKTFTWTTDEGDTIEIPMRVKLKVIRSLANQDVDDVATMFAILEQVIPNQAEVLDEQDVGDFAAMFRSWQSEYTKLAGATPGE
jgi:hypothetical protein